MKIFLIGMPGSGKTTLGKELAAHLMVTFVDLDAEIETVEQRTISDIFKQEGEEYFRALEAKLLREWAGGNQSFIMATGGGAPCFFDGMEVINQSGVSVFLDVPVDELIERVKQNKNRPLLLSDDEQQLRDKLTGMLKRRLACYRRSKIILRQPLLADVLKELGRITG
jgi:shikimate kinase